MNLEEKLTILTDSAKYDVACTSSGASNSNPKGAGIGSTEVSGICHSFSADGRCVSLLKVLMSNHCVYDCEYCVNRRSNDVLRAAFTPRELADLTINFYRRNYIEGLFLSSGVENNPDYATEQMIKTIQILRKEYNFTGYIHAKAIPGADEVLIKQLGLLVQRISVNIELPSADSLTALAPNKSKEKILKPMANIRDSILQTKSELTLYKHAEKFAPAGQSTQMIVGASPESDFKILKLTEGLYKKYSLKRVFFSAYIPVIESTLLPSIDTKPPLLREHRLYQADWLLRFYNFKADEILDKDNQDFNPFLDPKCNWALNNMHLFPVEINIATENELLRVPGIGPYGAKKIITARRHDKLDYPALKRMGIVLKRAQYFVTCAGKIMDGLRVSREGTAQALIDGHSLASTEQLSFFDMTSAALARKEAVNCIATRM